MSDLPCRARCLPTWRSHLILDGALFDALPPAVRSLVVAIIDQCSNDPVGTAGRVAAESMCHLLARHVSLTYPGATAVSTSGVYLPGALVAAVADATFSAVDIARASILGSQAGAWRRPELWGEVDCGLRRAVVAKALAATGGRYSSDAVLTAIQASAFVLAWSLGARSPENFRALLEQQAFLRARDAAYETWKRFEAARLPSRWTARRRAARTASAAQ